MIHKRYSDWFTNITQTDPQTLLKLTHQRYTNWATNVTRNRPTNVTQIDPHSLLKIGFTSVTKLKTLIANTARLKPLTLSSQMENQFINLQSESVGWFVYGRDLLHERVKQNKTKLYQENASKFKENFNIYLNSLAFSLHTSLINFKFSLK